MFLVEMTMKQTLMVFALLGLAQSEVTHSDIESVKPLKETPSSATSQKITRTEIKTEESTVSNGYDFDRKGLEVSGYGGLRLSGQNMFPALQRTLPITSGLSNGRIVYPYQPAEKIFYPIPAATFSNTGTVKNIPYNGVIENWPPNTFGQLGNYFATNSLFADTPTFETVTEANTKLNTNSNLVSTSTKTDLAYSEGNSALVPKYVNNLSAIPNVSDGVIKNKLSSALINLPLIEKTFSVRTDPRENGIPQKTNNDATISTLGNSANSTESVLSSNINKIEFEQILMEPLTKMSVKNNRLSHLRLSSLEEEPQQLSSFNFLNNPILSSIDIPKADQRFLLASTSKLNSELLPSSTVSSPEVIVSTPTEKKAVETSIINSQIPGFLLNNYSSFPLTSAISTELDDASQLNSYAWYNPIYSSLTSIGTPFEQSFLSPITYPILGTGPTIPTTVFNPTLPFHGISGLDLSQSESVNVSNDAISVSAANNAPLATIPGLQTTQQPEKYSRVETKTEVEVTPSTLKSVYEKTPTQEAETSMKFIESKLTTAAKANLKSTIETSSFPVIITPPRDSSIIQSTPAVYQTLPLQNSASNILYSSKQFPVFQSIAVLNNPNDNEFNLDSYYYGLSPFGLFRTGLNNVNNINLSK